MILINSFFRAESTALYSLLDTLTLSYRLQTASISIEPMFAAEGCRTRRQTGADDTINAGRRRVVDPWDHVRELFGDAWTTLSDLAARGPWLDTTARAASSASPRFLASPGVCSLSAEFVPECDFDLFSQLVHLLGQEIQIQLGQLRLPLRRHHRRASERAARLCSHSGDLQPVLSFQASPYPLAVATTSAPVAISPQASRANFILARNMTFIAPSINKATDVEIILVATNLPEA